MTTTYDAAVNYNAALTYNDLAASTRRYQVRRTDMGGGEICTLADYLDLAPIEEVLNGYGSWSFRVHNLDPLAPFVVDLGEVQVWRDGTHLATGVVVQSESTYEASGDRIVDETTFHVRGLPWYFSHRLFGDADRTNFCANADFEVGTSSWTATGTTFSVDGIRKKLNSSSAKLVSSVVGADWYIEQSAAIPPNGVGNLITLAAWYYIEDGTWAGAALEERGLALYRVDAAGSVVQFEAASIDQETPRGVWQRAEVTVQVPPNVAETVRWRLYSPACTIRWDAVTVTLMESVSYYDTDQATIAGAIVAHAQDLAYGKSSLNIGLSTLATGIKRDRHYQHAEHGSIASALMEFPALDDGTDWSIETTGGARSFTTHYPRKGTARAAFALAEFTRVAVTFDGDSAATSVVIGGEGDGPDREEGGAIDATAFGGLILEEWSAGPAGADIDSLDGRAAERLRLAKNPRVLSATLAPGLRIGAWLPGDTAVIAISHGRLVLAGTWRCVSTSLDPATDQLSFVANPA